MRRWGQAAAWGTDAKRWSTAFSGFDSRRRLFAGGRLETGGGREKGISPASGLPPQASTSSGPAAHRSIVHDSNRQIDVAGFTGSYELAETASIESAGGGVRGEGCR